ncbi:uncharacterized protein LOC129255745 [Lytechinus pictus]|uniref:uncharacterized protein LOC129255745 n=1 Tax=Lytechinus pictus TaxID=7653 RepID=UPI0030BA1258
MGRSASVPLFFILVTGFTSLKVSASALNGSVHLNPRMDTTIVGGNGILVGVFASITASDELTDINLNLACSNAKVNSTMDVLANFSSTTELTIYQVDDDNISATFASTSLSLGDVLSFSWTTQWYIPDLVPPAAVIACDLQTSFQNSSSMHQSEILYSNSLFVMGPKINLTDVAGNMYDGNNPNSVDIGEEIPIQLTAMVSQQSEFYLNIDMEPSNESIDIIGIVDASITNSSSRIVCGAMLTGQKCRQKKQELYPKGLSLGFYDDGVSIDGDRTGSDDLVLLAKVRFGDDDVIDGETAQLGVSMTTVRSHIWTSVVTFNISDAGGQRSAVMEVNPRMLTHNLYNGYEATLQIELEHSSSSRSSGRQVELHLMLSPHATYQGVSDLSLLTDPPIINDSFVIFKIGAVEILSRVQLLVNLTVNHAKMKAGVSQMVILTQAIYLNDTGSTIITQTPMVDVQFQYADKPAHCNHPWQSFESSCYHANASVLVDATVATQLCEEEGGSLAAIDTIFEERFLIDISPKDFSPFRFWIHENSTHLNWLPGQPDVTTECKTLVVAGYRIDGTESGGIESTCCTDLRYFICETPIDPPVERKDQFHGVPRAGQALTESWTCPCNYHSADANYCSCCRAGSFICNAPGSHVCAHDASQCPLEEYYDRSILSDDTGLLIACNNVDKSLSNPTCVFFLPLPSVWKALPLFIGDVVAYHSVDETLYAIGRDSKTYLRGKLDSVSSLITDWSVISTERLMTAISNGGLTVHDLVTSLDYTNGDLLAWTCCG